MQVQDEFSRVEDEIQAQVAEHVNSQQAKPAENLKRERVDERNEDDLEVVLERPVKRRHIFSEEDEIIDLTVD